MINSTEYEIERKFLIEYPDKRWLESNCKKAEIAQTYLKSAPTEEIRVRKRGINGKYSYFHTTKRKINDIKRVEIESEITESEYKKFLADADPQKNTLIKTRYCFVYKSQTFEIDVYPFWNDKAIMEIELRDESVAVTFPEQIRIIKEVTEDDFYKNSSLADIK